MCDNSKKAIEIIKRNVEKTHTSEKVEIYETTYENLLKNKIKEKLDIVFLDPPYDTDYAYQAIKIILKEDLIDENSIIIIETDQEKKITNLLKELCVEITDIRKYGRAYLIFLRKKRKG